MVLIKPIKPASQLKLEAAAAPKRTLLSLVQRKKSEHQGELDLSPLDAIRMRLMEQRKQSEETSENRTSTDKHAITPPPAEGESEEVFQYKDEEKDNSFKTATEEEDHKQEEKNLIEM
ncbi:hypothetical transcript [Echinococcus multilocularis]|uniref:Hypothetical transcript n=1 Tax=Echinococcus multilocularis TaxID=6211 RepID=A0A068Y4A1_ECHMU|nr:hypothetical transcript [Echinococcus multilocularis]